MSINMHPPTAICCGQINPNEPDKPRVLLTNPSTQRGSVHSTDQTSKNRPEWIFPRCPANMTYMLGCSLIITRYDDENTLPHDVEVLSNEAIWGPDEDPVDFVVRIHSSDSPIKRRLERNYTTKPCPHGIIVVVPCNPMVAQMMSGGAAESEKELARQALDMCLLRLLEEEDASMPF